MAMTIGDNPFVQAELADLTPDEAAARIFAAQIRAEAEAGDDVAPSARTATNIMPGHALSLMNSRFDVTRIPISRLIQMRRDPMTGFAFYFAYAQMVLQRFYIKGEDPRACAFIDKALREVYADLVGTFLEKLAYGYQGAVKRFGVARPDWTYLDKNDELGGEKDIWPKDSPIDAVIWKPFAGLPPDAVDPLWADDGSFAGIKYSPTGSLLTAWQTVGGQAAEFNVGHSLWFTNERQSVFNSVWGYPRLGYAYRFWWSFWFNWGLADRHFEKDADPPVKVWFPPNETIAGRNSRDIALSIGEKARSNSTIALPSDVIEASDGKATTVRKWDIEFLKGGGNFEVFAARFEQLQRFIMRALMLPEEAFVAKGANAGYNSTGQLLDVAREFLSVLEADLDRDINRYMIPQLLLANGFTDTRCEKVTRSNVADSQVIEAVIQAAANQDVGQLYIDIPELMEAAGLPVLSNVEIARKRKEVADQAKQMPPPPIAPNSTNGSAGVTPNGQYVGARERIVLNTDLVDRDTETVFLAELAIGVLADPVVLVDARRLREVWREAMAVDFADAAMLLQDFDGTSVELDESFLERWRRRASDRAQQTVSATRRVMRSIMRRASTVELERVGVHDFSWDPADDLQASRYINDRGVALVDGIRDTTLDQLRAYLSELQQRGVPKEHYSALVSAKFSGFAPWRSDKIVRTELSRAYNVATVLAGQDSGMQFKVRDGLLGPPRSDPECIARDGKMVSADEAIRLVQDVEHPMGTIRIELVR